MIHFSIHSSFASNPYYNSNSQKVADLFVSGGWNSQVQMFHDINEPGCRDYESGNPCDATYWTTSDNIPSCWTLGDYGYTTVMNQCIAKVTSLGAMTPTSAIFENRYEAYSGAKIIIGNPSAGLHGIIKDQLPLNILASSPASPYSAMHQFVSSGGCSGTNSLGCYTIQFDGSTGGGAGTPHTGTGVDTEGPQAIAEWLVGNKVTGLTLANDLVNRMVSSNWIGSGSTWQLGQVLFVMRVYSLDTLEASAFNAGVTKLWSLQNSQGYLPNSYSASGSGSGHDPENMDAGLLPFSYSLISMIQSDYGIYGGNYTAPPFSQKDACFSNPKNTTLPQSWVVSCSFPKQVSKGDSLTASLSAACASSCSWSYSPAYDSQGNDYSLSFVNNSLVYSTVAKTSGLIIISVNVTNLPFTMIQNPTLYVSDVRS